MLFIKRSPVEFFEPKPEVRDSFNRIEKTMVGYADDQFFVRQPELVLDLADWKRVLLLFPCPAEGYYLLMDDGMEEIIPA